MAVAGLRSQRANLRNRLTDYWLALDRTRVWDLPAKLAGWFVGGVLRLVSDPEPHGQRVVRVWKAALLCCLVSGPVAATAAFPVYLSLLPDPLAELRFVGLLGVNLLFNVGAGLTTFGLLTILRDSRSWILAPILFVVDCLFAAVLVCGLCCSFAVVVGGHTWDCLHDIVLMMSGGHWSDDGVGMLLCLSAMLLPTVSFFALYLVVAFVGKSLVRLFRMVGVLDPDRREGQPD